MAARYTLVQVRQLSSSRHHPGPRRGSGVQRRIHGHTSWINGTVTNLPFRRWEYES